MSFAVFGKLINSSLLDDQMLFPGGKVVRAFRSPDKSEYVLEQNSISTVLTIFILACIYPAIAVVSIFRSRTQES